MFQSLANRLTLRALHCVDAETAHGVTIRALASGVYPRFSNTSLPSLRQEVLGLSFPNPLGMAAGFDKNGEVPDAILGMGFGFAEAGTVTPRPQEGNPRPRLFRLPADQGVINRFGFNNEGHAALLARLEARKGRGGIVGVNVGANKDAADRVADYVAGIRTFAHLASYFTVNISSPNTPGLRDLQQASALDDLLARVLDARDAQPRRIPVLLKIAPDVTDGDLDDIVRVARARKLDGMIVSNTTITRPALRHADIAKETGGLSGKPVFALSTKMLAKTYLRVEGQFPLVGVGGVDGAAAALAKIEAGATLVQFYSAMVFKGPAMLGDIKRGLLGVLTREKLASLAPLVGRRASELAG